MPAALAEIAVGLAGDAGLRCRDRHDLYLQLLEERVQIGALRRVAVPVDDDGCFELVARRDHRIAIARNLGTELRALRLASQHRHHGRAVDDHFGNPYSS